MVIDLRSEYREVLVLSHNIPIHDNRDVVQTAQTRTDIERLVRLRAMHDVCAGATNARA